MPVAHIARPIVIFLVGPTAIGKTALSVVLAERIGGEIISADSMQVYRGMRLLSQSPDAVQRGRIRHHIIEARSPALEWSVAAFRAKAERAIRAILRRGRIPIVVGGSGLYVKALIDGLFPSPEADMCFRGRMARYAKRYGAARLHARLAAIDRASALTIHPNDLKRTIRALEIHHTTGKTMTELKGETHGITAWCDVSIFGLKASRATIYKRIDQRVGEMFASGVVDEVKRLRKRRLSRTARAVLGYNEIDGYLAGNYDEASAEDLLKQNTRRFAKRQLTWFKAEKRIKWFNIERMTSRQIVAVIAKTLAS